MQFQKTPLEGAWVIELERLADERGFFPRAFDRREFREHGLRWNDSRLGIAWPITPTGIASRDYPDYDPDSFDG